jgi:hypothetical protein
MNQGVPHTWMAKAEQQRPVSSCGTAGVPIAGCVDGDNASGQEAGSFGSGCTWYGTMVGLRVPAVTAVMLTVQVMTRS